MFKTPAGTALTLPLGPCIEIGYGACTVACGKSIRGPALLQAHIFASDAMHMFNERSS
jgi:hypothetical protein